VGSHERKQSEEFEEDDKIQLKILVNTMHDSGDRLGGVRGSTINGTVIRKDSERHHNTPSG
jgi:hypothetical protein